MLKVYAVNIIESERGWGQRVDDTIHFSSEHEAKEWARAYNVKYNSSDEVPDWYMYADFVGETNIKEEEFSKPYLL